MKIRAFEISKAQRGWVCEVYFTVVTSRQYTDEEMHIRTGSRWLVLAIIKGYLDAYWKARVETAKPGERKAKGWAE